ncbi:unnamed protein product [Didymodactylos carnosus]|uniref:Integrase zinc-binding domain-containing protein n=2 Tax=Didymodactylos carnosus TaxID=1234261 RepID=A0A815YE80_9BILA|nr:unnamed protein product [Didymodactylos carnosus]CAF4432730.1 unnamed protein product [Didymodactylos carnosus]
MQNKTLRNTLASRISILLQEYNIIQIIHIQGKKNCLPDYLPRHPIEFNDPDLIDPDYGLQVKPPPSSSIISVSGRSRPLQMPVAGAVTTRLQTRRAQQEQTTERFTSDSTFDQDSIDFNSDQKLSCNKFDIKQLKIEQDKDSNIKLKIEQLKKDPNKNDFVLKDDILYKLVQTKYSIRKKPVPYIPPSMIPLLLEASHNDPLSGHFAIHRTLAKLKHQFWWPDMKSSVEKYIKSCSKCQQFNISRQKKPGYLKPISPPEEPFQIIAIDYVGPLNRSPSENRYVLAITDLFREFFF